ncbi:hypothetical protein AB0958_12330 [Streptomyces sp. NPDC006655]|uniref:hypothetical protein n=1 Tax=Streptomyces sp. NPDC006655 TaxID=3156898 RepID=UPI0034521E5C
MSRRTGLARVAGPLLAGLLAVLATACSGSAGPARPDCPDSALTCPASGSTGTPGTRRTPGTAGTAAPTAATGTPSGPGATAPGSSGASGKPAPQAACASPAACGFPDARSTGPRIPLTPHRTGNLSVRENGTVIRGWDITGSLDVYADDVTVIDTRITSANWWGVNLRPGHKGLRILHTTITAVPGKGPDNGGVDYAVSNMGTSSVEVGWCDVSVFGDALSMGQGDIHDNYVHDIAPFVNQSGEWQHTNAVISGGGNTGHLVVRHNTLLNPTGLKQGASGSIGLFADAGVVRNVTVDHNWIAGGAYALYGGATGATGIKVTNNVFSTQYHPASGGYGTVAHWNADGAGNEWRGNRLSDGRPVQPEPSP